MRATGKDVRDNLYVLHLTVLPGADTSYRHRQMWGTLATSSTWLSYFNWPELCNSLGHKLDSDINLDWILSTFLLYQHLKSEKNQTEIRLLFCESRQWHYEQNSK